MKLIGIDLGKISFKAVWLEGQGGSWEIQENYWKIHQQEIKKIWEELKKKWQISEEDRIIVTGRLRKTLPFPSVVEKIAQEEAARFFYPQQNLTLIRVGGGGFSVLKIKTSGPSEFKQNSRCAAGVGSFLDQIMTRVGLNVLQADQLAGDSKGIEITSRCGVTMKTDFTHLLNTGHKLEEVMAGLLDSSAKNAAALAQKTEVFSPVLIIGGLSNLKRITTTIQKSMSQGIKVEVPPQAVYFEALGAALIGRNANDFQHRFSLEKGGHEPELVFLPSLKNYLSFVTKIEPQNPSSSSDNSLILGLDIGSTGSKLVIFGDVPLFEAYVPTKGQPVQAAKNLIKQIPPQLLAKINKIGCTGSGREIVANLLKASLSRKDHQRIFVLNEIAAHAQGAQYYDNQVDTVVDIGGQDAKFTRLESGRVIDSCMNTVCSAGTGSFLAEQLQLLGISDVREFGRIALESPRAVDLGQHCAVFISEQIDEAKRKGATLPEIVAGLYYSIILNYNNRVKGLRDYGKKIFLQGKPAENIALACALAKVTGYKIVVPSSPGSTGALGIAILAKKELRDFKKAEPLNLTPFLDSQILDKRDFRCHSKDGCLAGNLCPVQVIKVKIHNNETRFFWGGACDKYEKKSGKNLALAKSPRPFIERERLISDLAKNSKDGLVKTVAIPRGLETEEILPLAVTFFQELGFKVKLADSPSIKFLEEGSKLCQATFCAPLQLLAGQAKLFEVEDFVFLPKVIEISGLVAQPQRERCYVCPLSQATPDLFSPKLNAKVLQPILNFKMGYEANQREFVELGYEVGCAKKATISAFKKAVLAQHEFETKCLDIGKKALEFAKNNQVPVVVILGHPYIVNSSLFSAGIAESVQENDALALPADCYPLSAEISLPKNMYWGYGQRLLQAAWQIRRQPGIYPLWLAVYSCGPDSFLLHFFQYLAQGKPFTILESDAHTGQAGFKTRVEAFLYGIRNYKKDGEKDNLPDFRHFDREEDFIRTEENKRSVLIPWMGESSKIFAALLKSVGIKSQTLPLSNKESLRLGQGLTSGKECLPMIITLGGLLEYLKDQQGNFYYFMPQANGPCRFGQYQLLFKIILEKLGLTERVKVISPTSDDGYQFVEESGLSMTAKMWTAVVFCDLLKDALYDVRPEEKISGSTQKVFDYYLKEAERIIVTGKNGLSNLKDLWGFVALAKEAVKTFSLIPKDPRKFGKPTVLLTGEIYVRLDSFANNDLIRELEDLGVKVKLSPFREWINYVTYLRLKGQTIVKSNRLKVYLTHWMQKVIEQNLYRIFVKTLGWPKDHHVDEILRKAEPYLRGLKPLGETALTIGLPLLLWQKKEIVGTVVVGPFECMPTRIAESQLGLISQKNNFPILVLHLNGDPLEKDLLESFVWDIKK